MGSYEPTSAPSTDQTTIDALRLVVAIAHTDLATELGAADLPDDVLLRMVTFAQRLIPDSELAALTLIDAVNTVVTTAAATGSLAHTCDEFQTSLREGPNLVPLDVGVVLRCDDLESDLRWPRFAAVAVAAGVVSMMVCGLPTTGDIRHSLTWYSGRPDAFDDAGELAATVFASRVTEAILHEDKLRNLRRAIDSRQVIGQASGILMERHKISADEAFGRLVHESQRTQLKLRELAVRLVETGEDPEAVVA